MQCAKSTQIITRQKTQCKRQFKNMKQSRYNSQPIQIQTLTDFFAFIQGYAKQNQSENSISDTQRNTFFIVIQTTKDNNPQSIEQKNSHNIRLKFFIFHNNNVFS